MPTIETNEKYFSQLPALMEIINLGYQYLTPARMNAVCGRIRSPVFVAV